MQQEEKILKIRVEDIVPNRYQPRKTFDEQELEELSKSIETYGILNPILVRKKEDKYEIIAGERRYKAAIKAGLKEVPVIEKTLKDNELAELALIENIQRQNLSPIEEASSYEEIMKLSNITQQELGIKLGKSQSSIANKLRLLTLPNQIKDALLNRKISERHARSLMKVPDETKQLNLLERIIKEKLTVKDLDNIINEKNITEAEIQSAIKDIVKSLNLTIEEEKEEKESDKMNNDNFFPSFNNTMGANNNVSLNTMNMQSQENKGPVTPVQETVMPTMPQTFEMPNSNNMQSVPFQNVIEPSIQQPETSSIDAPLFGRSTIDTPTINIQDVPLFTSQSLEKPEIQDTPLFDGNFSNPTTTTPINNFVSMNNNIEPASTPSPIPTFGFENQAVPTSNVQTPEQVIETPMIDPPLFNLPETNQEPVLQTSEMPVLNENQTVESTPIVSSEPVTEQNTQPEETSLNESFYNVPVNISPVIEETTSNNKLVQVQELLSQNGISYKSYSNDTGHCIIIEL